MPREPQGCNLVKWAPHGDAICASIPAMTKAVVINAQRLRSLLAAALRVLRHHYFTFITAGVLGGIVFVAMTSSSFSDREPDSSSSSRTESIWPKPAPGFTPRGRAMIYYIVESNEQASTMERALRSDVTYSEMNGGPPRLRTRDLPEPSNADGGSERRRPSERRGGLRASRGLRRHDHRLAKLAIRLGAVLLRRKG